MHRRVLRYRRHHAVSIETVAVNQSHLLRFIRPNVGRQRLADAPGAIRFWNNRARLRDIAGRQSKTTHGAPEAIDACIAFAEVLADAIEGRSRLEVLRTRSEPYVGAIGAIMRGQWREKARAEIRSTGYVAYSLEAALWCVDRGTDYRGVLVAANLGEDADTTAAITAVHQAFPKTGLVGSPGEGRSRQWPPTWLGRQCRTRGKRVRADEMPPNVRAWTCQNGSTPHDSGYQCGPDGPTLRCSVVKGGQLARPCLWRPA
jgi:hypothetical protein